MTQILFDPIEHKYTNSLGERYLSVTQLVELFIPKFDEQFWLAYKALQSQLGFDNTEQGKKAYKKVLFQNGWKFEDWGDKNVEKLHYIASLEGIYINTKPTKKQWKDINEEALAKGTKFHNETEAIQLEKQKTEFIKKGNEVRVITDFDGDIAKVKENGVIPEMRLYNHQYKIAGTTDQPYFELPYFDINDWKGLALDTPMLTSTGWKTMGDLQRSDYIYSGEGKLTKILNVSEIHYNPCYEIVFDTNEKIVADHEHKWVITKRNRKGVYENLELTTEMIADAFNKKQRVMIDCVSLNTEEKELPLDPYVLGLYLADGNRTCSSITNINPKIWEEVKRRGYEIGLNHNRNFKKAESRTVLNIRKHLKSLNVLNNKHIPFIYLTSSYKQRLDLLRGFMDGDGYFHKKRKRCSMNTTKKWQADAFLELVSSLGWKPTLFSYDGEGFGKKVKEYEVCFSPTENPFLARNSDYVTIMNTIPEKSKIRAKYRYIKSIKLVDTVPTKCLEVESPCHTYLAGKGLIKTHNTNKEIKYENKYSNMLYCLSHLQDCNFNHYNIQLSLYAWMLEQYGYKTRNIGITHILFNNLGEAQYTYYIPMKYLKKEIEEMLEYYDKNLRNNAFSH